MPYPSSLSPQPLLLVGPTGVGKTAVAVELCELLNGEVVSADSMQIYRGCDIATAKPTPQEKARAPHHLIDIREPAQRYSAAEWAQDAQVAINDIITRGRQPIIVGGTGFYIRALLEPATLAEVPPDPALRTRLESEAATHGKQWLHDYLATLDQEAAQRLHPNDVRRVIRAIEVAQGRHEKLPNEGNDERNNLEGNVKDNDGVSASPSPLLLSGEAGRVMTFGLDMPRQQLYERLEKRIDDMLKTGMVDELRMLVDKGVPFTSPVMQGLGYRQMLPVLNNPELIAECVVLWKRDTRRYAKRQLTWFRHQLPVHWITITPDQSAGKIAQSIVQEWNQRDANETSS